MNDLKEKKGERKMGILGSILSGIGGLAGGIGSCIGNNAVGTGFQHFGALSGNILGSVVGIPGLFGLDGKAGTLMNSDGAIGRNIKKP